MPVYIRRRTGVRKGPRKFPIVLCTTVNAVFPPACLVMTTLLLIVVGTHPVMIMPMSSHGSIKRLFVAAMLTMAKVVADVMRKHWICTKRWSLRRA